MRVGNPFVGRARIYGNTHVIQENITMTNDLVADRYIEPAHRDRSRPSRSAIVGFAVSDDRTPLSYSLVAFALLLAVGLVHIQDQGGFIGSVTPLYMAIGYYAVEVGAAITIPLVLRKKTVGWLLGAVFSAGPFIAYILSRTVGLPGDPGDVGNWGYTLGTVSLVVEGTLFLLCVTRLLRVFTASPPSKG
jgi:hypothetical protein